MTSRQAIAFRGELVPQAPNDEPAEVMLARLQAARRPSRRGSAKQCRPSMADPTAPVRIELPDDVALFAAYGASLFVACQLQHSLGTVYAMSFGDWRAGSLPRVHEKMLETFEATLGQTKNLALEFLPRPLRDDVELAVQLRNYI